MDSKQIKKIIFVSSIIIFVYLIIDYLNLFSLIGLNAGRINENLLGIIVNSVVVISLYLVTFEFVDKRNEARERNKVLTAKHMLKHIYSDCINNMEYMDDAKLRPYITRYVDPDKTIEKDNKFRIFEESPFNDEASLMEFFNDGTLSKDVYDSYLANKMNYFQFMTISLIFPDVPYEVDKARQKALSSLNKSIDILDN